jgi:AcrR family transcriptional regulator
MKKSRVDVGQLRRGEIIEAAVAIIAEQGLQNLSLSEIEARAGMSRGQLTYYFPTKEGILLAVFDRLLEMMHERLTAGQGGCPFAAAAGGWDRLRHFLTVVMLQPPQMPGFHALHYTFLSQIGHRKDFRDRLAGLYEAWRAHMAEDIAAELRRRPGPAVSPRTFATFVQALLHGLGMQRAADPEAYDRQEMLNLCLDLLGGYLQAPGPEQPRAANGTPKNARGRRPAQTGEP